MPFDGSKPMPAQDLLDEFIHRQTHLVELQKQFPDIVAQDMQNSMELQSAAANPLANTVRLNYEYMDRETSIIIHYIYPYLELGQDCAKCKERKEDAEDLCIITMPRRIPLALSSDYTERNYLYTFNYEDYLAEHNFSKYVFDQCRLNIIEIVQKTCSRSRPKKDEVVISNNIKKLLIFS